MMYLIQRLLFSLILLYIYDVSLVASFCTVRPIISPPPANEQQQQIGAKTALNGVLSRSDIIRASRSNRNILHRHRDPTLSEIVAEALARQERIRHNLEREEQRGDDADDGEDDEKARVKTQRRKYVVQEKLKELQSADDQLRKLQLQLSSDDISMNNEHSSRIRQCLIDLGFESLLSGEASSPDNWISVQEYRKEFGRPNGFTGLVFQSSNQVPILVGKMGVHADETLRRISQGSDLWFQVENYEGSRVLLRTSLCRGYRDSRACMQMAADLAAYYSTSRWGQNDSSSSSSKSNGTVNVMYTDSKHVAKRGSKAGRLRKKKSLGRIVARPDAVQDIAKGKEP